MDAELRDKIADSKIITGPSPFLLTKNGVFRAFPKEDFSSFVYHSKSSISTSSLQQQDKEKRQDSGKQNSLEEDQEPRAGRRVRRETCRGFGE
ncbi:hypothetical protein ACTXT7_014612 [Hymenolepis weldensis]